MTVRRWYRCRKLSTSTVRFFVVSTFILVVLMTILVEPPPHFFTKVRLRIFGNEIGCYRDHGLDTLPDISDNLPPLTAGSSIFFHETSCASKIAGRIVVTGRQACAVESAALLHPHRKVYLLFTSPGVLKPGLGDKSDVALNALLSYSNVILGHVDFARYLNNTPLEHLYSSGSIELSNYAGSHASDVLRYLTLWKYGGVYLDLDVVVTKQLDDLGVNYAGRESDENVAAGVLGLAPSGEGHQWASACLADLSGNFSGRDWGNNGPGVITRLLRRLCGVQRAVDMGEKECGGFRVLPPEAFYPVPWWTWGMYFEAEDADRTMEAIHNSYAIHVWNRHSHNTQVTPESAYARVARQFCPKVYSALADKDF